MSNDLISREALTEEMRKSINERYPKWDKPITVADIATLIFDVIDNAPTVELEKTGVVELKKDLTEEEKETLKKALRNTRLVVCSELERPQGEWIPTTSGGMCPFCGQVSPNGFTQCRYCGAQMRGGAE